MQAFGDKDTLLFEIGDNKVYGQLPVAIHAAGRSLISGDNHIHAGSFAASLQAEKALIESGDIPAKYAFFRHGNPLKSVRGRIEVDGGLLRLHFRLLSGEVLEVSMPRDELLASYAATIACLNRF